MGRLDVDVELSGGIRDDDVAATPRWPPGVARVNLGTAALEDPTWCAKAIAEHGDRIAVGLDVRGTTLAARGWTQEGGDLWETLERLDRDGCARYVVTDVTKDGTLRGPEPRAAARGLSPAPTDPWSPAAESPRSPTCGRSPRCVPIGVEGAIVGKALYAGAFTLQEALADGVRARDRAWDAVGRHRGAVGVAVRLPPGAADRRRGVGVGHHGGERGRRTRSGRRRRRHGRRSASRSAHSPSSGCAPSDVVRTRMYVTDRADTDAVGPVHGELFAAAPPAATMVVVAGLIDPRLLVEVELDARRHPGK